MYTSIAPNKQFFVCDLLIVRNYLCMGQNIRTNTIISI